jgi:hypothetical protein
MVLQPASSGMVLKATHEIISRSLFMTFPFYLPT